MFIIPTYNTVNNNQVALANKTKYQRRKLEKQRAKFKSNAITWFMNIAKL